MNDVLRLLGAAAVVGLLAVAVTKVDAGPGDAAPRTLSATGAASLTDSIAGDAVLRAGDMAPGESTTGTVTVDNGGDATGFFKLAQIDVLDTPGASGRRLSASVRLRVEDVENRRAVYVGPLGAMQVHPLGYLRAGQERTYRFTVTLPASASAEAFAGARVETKFDWTASTAEPPADTVPPRVVAQIAGTQPGEVVVAVTSDERSVVTGASPGARPESRQRLLPGRPVLLTLRVTRAAELPLRITVADAAGNRTTATPARSRRGDSNP